jgi:general secretion pathway protein B
MSFILDALKKSETERQRQTIPGLVDSGFARQRPRLPPWALGLCVLLGVNLIVLAVVLLRGWTAASPAPHGQAPGATRTVRVEAPPATGDSPAADAAVPAEAPSEESKPAGTEAVVADGHFSPLDAPPIYAPEIPMPGASAAGTGAATAQPPMIRQPLGAASPDAHPMHRRDPVLNNEDYRAADDEVLPSISEINLGTQALPELHLDVHVFATKSAERFVYVNMRKYHEGATLQEGPTIERIRRDGVILDYNGLRFLLPRQ